MKFILNENQFNFLNEELEGDLSVLNQYLKSKPELIPLYKEIEKTLNDKFKRQHFDNEILYSKGLKSLVPLLDSNAVKSFNQMVNKYKLECKIKKSSLRNYQTQKKIFIKMSKDHGGKINGGLRQASLPGFSQHHTGKAFDITNYNSVTDKMLNEFGFIRPYSKDTGFRMAEPWHILYTK